MTLLPEILNCNEFVNADGIAKGISPFNPEQVAFEAGRIMLHRIDELMRSKVDFAFETTLSTKSYSGKVRKAQELGYHVTLLFFWLPSQRLAIERVEEGGHDIPEHVIKRRFVRGIENLLNIYLNLCDETIVVDNRNTEMEVIAEATKDDSLVILNEEKWKNLNSFSDGE